MNCDIYQRGKKVPQGSVNMDSFSEEYVDAFETLRFYQGALFYEEEHLDRFEESLKTIGSSFVPNRMALRSELRSAIQSSGLKEGIIRLTVLFGEIFVLLGTRSVSTQAYAKGVKLQTTALKRSPPHADFAEAKTSAYHNPLFASFEHKNREVFEWLFLNSQGYVAETRVGNIFIVEQGGLQTPPMVGILNGVTRRFVIKCASQIGIETQENYFTRHELWNASEVFITNTSWEILPVCEVDGRKINQGIPGKITAKLQQQFKKQVRKQCQKTSRSKGL